MGVSWIVHNSLAPSLSSYPLVLVQSKLAGTAHVAVEGLL